MEPVPYLSIASVAERIRSRELSPVDVVEAVLSRIERLAPRLNAFITVLAADARERAREAEAEIQSGNWRGPLHGIPVAIKDFYDTAGVKTTAAFEPFKDRVPKKDAVSVAKLKNAGAIVVGKTNMHRLGMGTTGLESAYGPVRNPWNDAYIPGGSSSGSAAAVAAGLCYASLDTDAIGSCRLPAACCGVVGFKGTYGLVSAKGILEGEQADEAILWLSHPGITARTVEDAAIMLNALAEPPGAAEDYRAETRRAEWMRVAVANNFTADADISAAFTSSVELIRGSGHEILDARAPFEMPRFGDVANIEADRKSIAGRAFADIDVLVLPTTATTTPRVDASSNAQALSPQNTMFTNYFGLPAISVPCGMDSRGLPIGLQVVGKPGGDATVLRLAHQFLTSRPIVRAPV
jgi:aspartyl-tRNA(Asn)/glutamyl-tRNA(Gln) amidotransferase subunit A